MLKFMSRETCWVKEKQLHFVFEMYFTSPGAMIGVSPRKDLNF